MPCKCFFINTKMEDKNMKKTISISISVLLLIFLSTVSAHADRKTMEGFLIGTGVAILGTAIYHGMNKDSNSQPQYSENHQRRGEYHSAGYNGYKRGHKHKHHRRHHYKHRGHWEVERVWMEPVYEKKWNPGHYGRHGDWVSGRYERFIVKEGYYREERVWVRY